MDYKANEQYGSWLRAELVQKSFWKKKTPRETDDPRQTAEKRNYSDKKVV